MSEDEEDARPDRSRFVLALALVLAVAATVALIVTDSAVWLRFAVLAALWAAVVGGGVAFVYRRRCAEREQEMADLRSRYEEELDREISARREYELEVETEIRKEIESANTEVLHNLRDEVQTLRADMEAMLGGEVLVERIALHAESTRMRQVPDSPNATMRRPPVQRRGPEPVQGRPEPGPQQQPAPVGDPRGTRIPARLEPTQRPAPGQHPQPSRPAEQAPADPGRGSGSGYRAPAAVRREGAPQDAPQPGTHAGTPPATNGFAVRQAPGGAGNDAPAQPNDRAADAEQNDEPAGAHAAGTSVTELLAAHGGVSGGRRHHRRAE